MNTPLRRSGMARVLKGYHSFTCTPRNHPLTEWTIPAFAFPAEAGTHLPTRRHRRLSWPWVAGWLHTEINVRHRELNLDTVAHLSTNWTRRRLTSLIEANVLTTTPDHQTWYRCADTSSPVILRPIVSGIGRLHGIGLTLVITYLLTYSDVTEFTVVCCVYRGSRQARTTLRCTVHRMQPLSECSDSVHESSTVHDVHA